MLAGFSKTVGSILSSPQGGKTLPTAYNYNPNPLEAQPELVSLLSNGQSSARRYFRTQGVFASLASWRT